MTLRLPDLRFANTPHSYYCSPSVHRRRLSQTQSAAPCRTFPHTHARRIHVVGLREHITFQDPSLFTFSFQDSFFRLGYESATLLMVMITDSSRSISCSMRRADMTLPCTCWLGGWLQHMRANCFALSYPVLSSHRHSLPTCT
jgi:hypothetical protein